MKNSFCLKNIVTFALLIMVGVLIPVIKPKAEIRDVTLYEDRNFYEHSAPEPILVDFDTDTISFCAVCDGDTADTITCYVSDLSNNGANNHTFTFDADGNIHTYIVPFEHGIYRIYFVGSSTIKKTDAIVVFTVVD